MELNYFEWDQELINKLKSFAELNRLFNQILLRVNGDVDRAMELMEQIQSQGYLPPDVDLKQFKEQLKENRSIQLKDGKLSLSARGERDLRKEAFEEIFQKMKSDGRGEHSSSFGPSSQSEPLPEKRPYEFGDDFDNIDFKNSLFNSIHRSGSLDLDLTEDDLESCEQERSTNCATVLMIDISHSMILYGEDRITPAKQVAMAFTHLILNRYPKDYLAVVVFGDDASEIKIKDLPYLSVGPYHTNTQQGLRLARELLLKSKHPNKQIFMITDGKPSMIKEPNGEYYKNSFGLDPRIVNKTLEEAVTCRKKGIPITTFMITDDPYLQQFVEKLTELNQGRAFFSSVNNLAGFVLMNFVTNRKRRRQ